MIKQRYIESLGCSLPLLGFGGMRLPLREDKQIDYDQAKKMVDYALANGVDYFDTAYMYLDSQSEPFFGRALAEYPRKSYRLTTKMPAGWLKEEGDLERIFSEQLARCKTDYFDFYLLHSVTKKSLENAEKFGAIPFLLKMKEAGKIRHLGFSFHDDEACLKKALAAAPWEFVQLQLNYYDFELGEAKRLHRIALEAGLPVFVMEPVRGGFLANLPEEALHILRRADSEKSAAAFALEWVAELPGVAMMLSGMSNFEQVADNIKTFSADGQISAAQKEAVAECAAYLAGYKTVPCTGCRYCMPCPAGVKIPETFQIYNDYMLMRASSGAKFKYADIAPENRASACVHCRKCISACPQHLEIPTLLAEAHGVLSQL